MQAGQLLQFATQCVDDMKARDIVTLDLEDKSSEMRYFFICSGTSTRHTKAIAWYLIAEARRLGLPVLGREGERYGEWVLVDLGELVVHIMLADSREFYQLEKLWAA